MRDYVDRLAQDISPGGTPEVARAQALVQRLPGLRDADIALTEIIQGKIKPGMPEEIAASEE